MMYGGQKWAGGGPDASVAPHGGAAGFPPPVGYQYQPTRPPANGAPLGGFNPYGATADAGSFGYQPLYGSPAAHAPVFQNQGPAAPMLSMSVGGAPGVSMGSGPQANRRQAQQQSPPQSPADIHNEGGQSQTVNPEKFKTELCRKFALTGFCRYGDMCQFAHGAHELRALVRHPLYKTSPCKSFESTGACRYGARCRFIHDEDIQQLATLARGVPALNLQISEPSWEEAQAATLDAVQHMVVSTGLSPQVAAVALTQQSPQLTAVLPQLPPPDLPLAAAGKPPKAPIAAAPGSDAKKSSLRQTPSKIDPDGTSRVLSSPPAASNTGEIRSISSLIMLNSNGASVPSAGSSQNGTSPSLASQPPQRGNTPQQRVGSSVKLVIDEDVFPPANLDARRLPVAGSTSWVNLAEATPVGSQASRQRSPGPSSSSFADQQQLRQAMKHSYSQPVLGGDPWRAFSSNDIASMAAPASTTAASAKQRQVGGSIASLPVYPPNSPLDNGSAADGLLGAPASSLAGGAFSMSTSSPNLARYSSNGPVESNFKKAASYANHMWFNATIDEDLAVPLEGWSSMARARSVEGRLDIFRNMSDPDLARMAQANNNGGKSFEEKLGDVGLTLSDDEDHGADEADRSGDNDGDEDEGFTMGQSLNQ